MKNKGDILLFSREAARQRMWSAHPSWIGDGLVVAVSKWELASKIRVAVIPRARNDANVTTPEIEELVFADSYTEIIELEDT